MKTRFFFALPVVAMIAMTTTVANAAVNQAKVDRPIGPRMVEVASINKVDAKVDAMTRIIVDAGVDARLAEVRDKVDANINKLNPNQKNQEPRLCLKGKTPGKIGPCSPVPIIILPF